MLSSTAVAALVAALLGLVVGGIAGYEIRKEQVIQEVEREIRDEIVDIRRDANSIVGTMESYLGRVERRSKEAIEKIDAVAEAASDLPDADEERPNGRLD